jgi:hypothetical protein
MPELSAPTRPRFEVGDIVRRYADAYLATHTNITTHQHRRVLHHIAACRTATLGGHLMRCDEAGCSYETPAYNSCGDRHDPKCGGPRRAQWLECRSDELLDVPYFHAVFTLPHELNAIALQNKEQVYGLLMRCAADTLLESAAEPRLLGARIGFFGILHTWGQDIGHHPHGHFVIPGGGLAVDDPERWVTVRRPDYLLPIPKLRKMFRTKFLMELEQTHAAGELVLAGKLSKLEDPRAFKRYLAPLWKKDWVVYAKPPFGGPEQVLKYVARYTHRVAISNHRLLSIDGGRVSFRYKDYRDGQHKVMSLESDEFLRRFLLHVLPRGFKRIRHYGIFAGSDRRENLAKARRLLGRSYRPRLSSSPDPKAAVIAAEVEEQREPASMVMLSIGHLAVRQCTTG